jgi:small-conductance mechanosensitive channel
MDSLAEKLKPLFDLNDWLSVALVSALALAAALVAFRIGRRIAARPWFSHSALGLMLRRCESSMQLIAPAIALLVVLETASNRIAHIDLVRHWATAFLIAASTFGVASAISAFGDWVIQRHPFNVADNLEARRLLTKTRVVVRTINTILVLVGLSMALITFPAARKFGVSLLASAGAAGLVLGLAAKPVLGNLLAGLQIAVAQPIRIDDVLIVQGEWGRVEEITGTYVVLHIWDGRRLIIPLQWIIENPFQNWTRTSADIINTIMLWVDYRTPIEPLRAELKRLVEAAPEWDRKVSVLQVTDANTQAIQVRIIASSADSGRGWDLQCKIREGMIRFLQRKYPDCLPRARMEFAMTKETAHDRA